MTQGTKLMQITDADREAWEVLGPKVFHLEMTGAEVVAIIRKAERDRIVAWLRDEACESRWQRCEDLATAIEKGAHCDA